MRRCIELAELRAKLEIFLSVRSLCEILGSSARPLKQSEQTDID